MPSQNLYYAVLVFNHLDDHYRVLAHDFVFFFLIINFMKLICIENDVCDVTSLVKMTLFNNKATYTTTAIRRLLRARGGSYYLIL